MHTLLHVLNMGVVSILFIDTFINTSYISYYVVKGVKH